MQTETFVGYFKSDYSLQDCDEILKSLDFTHTQSTSACLGNAARLCQWAAVLHVLHEHTYVFTSLSACVVFGRNFKPCILPRGVPP